MIRRNAKTKNKATRTSQLNLEASTNHTYIATSTRSGSNNGVHSHLTADIKAAREQLSNIDAPEQHRSPLTGFLFYPKTARVWVSDMKL